VSVVFEWPKFDVHAPFDAPLRMRELHAKREHEQAMEYMRSEEFRRLIEPIVKKAYETMRGGPVGVAGRTV
jgi:hypothetical protein